MTDLEYLKYHRQRVEEMALLKRQIEYLEDRADDDHRLMPHLKDLQAQLAEDEKQLQRDKVRFQFLLSLAPAGRRRLVIQQYYGWGMKDEAVAECLGLSCRSVNHSRNAYLTMLKHRESTSGQCV